MSELGAHHSRVSMHTRDPAPDGTNAALWSSAACNFLVSLVDVDSPLSKIELGIVLNFLCSISFKLNVVCKPCHELRPTSAKKYFRVGYDGLA